MSVLTKLQSTFAAWQRSPNPILMRELRQDARLVRTPWLVMGVVVILALFIASIGTQRVTMSPDQLGMSVFQGFFIVAYFAMTLIGPALSANAVAAEREGRTWEALLLTGMTARQITRGKFLAAATSLGMYVVAAIPVSAMSFLFGGVQWYELLIGFFYLFWVTMLSVAFGLAVSSRMAQARSAIVLTLLCTFPLSGIAFGMFGPGAADGIHLLWPEVPDTPYWLPLAYGRGQFDVWYVVILILAPAFIIGLPLWGLYESTLANLTEPTDDRSTGLKLWFSGLSASATAIGVAVIFATALPGARSEAPLTVLGGIFVVSVIGLFILIPDPLGASRRVRKRWELERVGAVRRWFGPGLVSTVNLIGLIAACAIGTVVVSTAIARSTAGSSRLSDGVLEFTAYSGSFLVFMIGLALALRSRSNNAVLVRVLLVAFVLGITLIPIIAAGIVGVVAYQDGDGAWFLAAPSPIYIERFISGTQTIDKAAGWAACALWLVVGIGLYAQGRNRIGAIVLDFEERFKASDRMFRDEDAQILESLQAVVGETNAPEPSSPSPEPAATSEGSSEKDPGTE